MKISLSNLGGQLSFEVDGLANNPPLHITKGDKISIEIDTPAHPFCIKTALGQHYSYLYTPVNSGISSGRIVWEVLEEIPQTLYYQSAVDQTLWGYILVRPLQTANGFRLVNLNNLPDMSVDDLVDIMNHNAAIGLTRTQDLAGEGLQWDGNQLSLDAGISVYEDSAGLFKGTRVISINDNVDVTGRPVGVLSITQALDDIATQIKRIVGGARWNSPAPATVANLNTRIERLLIRVNTLNAEVAKLQEAYSSLVINYQRLLEIYAKHKHSATDVVAGNFNPARLAQGEWAPGRIIVVGRNGELYWQDAT